VLKRHEFEVRSWRWNILDSDYVHQTTLFNRVHYHIAVWAAEYSAFACVDGSTSDILEFSTRKHATISEFVGKDGAADSLV
jgi:hypothetical protein